MIEVALFKIWGSQFVGEKIEIGRNRHIRHFIVLKRIGHQKSEIRLPIAFITNPDVYWNIGHLTSRNIVAEIWENAHEISFADFWSSVDLPHL